MTTPNVYTNQLQTAGDKHEILVKALVKQMGSHEDNLMHAAAGIAGEAGELLDAIKKVWAYNKPIDLANVIEELGDLEFYMRALRVELGLVRDDILLANIDKLERRYPKGVYSDMAAQARADKQALIFPQIDTKLLEKLHEDNKVTCEVQAIENGERL